MAMKQPEKPGFKKWLMVTMATLGIGGFGGIMTGGSLPDFNASTQDDSLNNAAMTETIPADSPDIVWATVQKPLSVDFNNISAKAQQEMLNMNLQSAASMGRFDTVENLLNQGADAKADDSAALKLALTGSKSATAAADQQSFDRIAKLLQERGAVAGDQQSLADKTASLSGQSTPTPEKAPPTVPPPGQ